MAAKNKVNCKFHTTLVQNLICLCTDTPTIRTSVSYATWILDSVRRACPSTSPSEVRCTLYSYTAIQLYSCTVVQFYSCTVVQLYNCTVEQLYSCTVVQLYSCLYMYIIAMVKLDGCIEQMYKFIHGNRYSGCTIVELCRFVKNNQRHCTLCTTVH